MDPGVISFLSSFDSELTDNIGSTKTKESMALFNITRDLMMGKYLALQPSVMMNISKSVTLSSG